MRRSIGGVEYRDTGSKPVYTLIVEQRPSAGSKLGKKAYANAVQEVAKGEIPSPLTWMDLDVEILCLSRVGINIDLDNVIRSTLNVLAGLAYQDDRQVRSLRAARFDPALPMRLHGSTRGSEALFKAGAEHRVVILIYSAAEQRYGRTRTPNPSPPSEANQGDAIVE